MGSGHETSWHLATQNHKYVVGKGASLCPFVCKAKMEEKTRQSIVNTYQLLIWLRNKKKPVWPSFVRKGYETCDNPGGGEHASPFPWNNFFMGNLSPTVADF